jgi:hypothetical protein
VQYLGLKDREGNLIKPSDLIGQDDWITKLADLFFATVTHIFCETEKTLRSIGGDDLCVGTRQTNLDAKVAVIGWIERIFAADLCRIKKPIQYEQQYLCPSTLPDPQHAIDAWVRGEIDDDLLDCWAMANGMLPAPFHKIRDAHRARWTVNGILDLYRRKIIGEDDLNTRLRDIGHVRTQDYVEARELAKMIPPYNDIIRMMVRDTDDESIPDWPDSDASFKIKYGEQLQKWGEAQGLPEQAAK